MGPHTSGNSRLIGLSIERERELEAVDGGWWMVDGGWWTGFVGAGNGNGIGRAQKGGKLCWPTSFHAGCICRCIPRKTPRYPNPFSMFSPAFPPRLPLSFT